MRQYSVQKLVASLIGLAFVAGGCDCFDPVPDTRLNVEITEPAASTLTRESDANAEASDGFQLQVVAVATDSEGSREPEIDGATLEIRQGGATVGAPVEASEIQGTTIRFPLVTVAPGDFTIFVQARERTRYGEVEKNITVPLVTNRPEVTAIAVEGDANADGILNLMELPTGQPVLIATIQRAEGGTARVLYVGAGNQEVGAPVAIANGQARIPLDSLMVQPEGDYQLAVEVTEPGGQKNQLEAGTGADARNDAAFITLRVDRVAPTVTFSQPLAGALLGMNDDADGDSANGYQVQVAGTVSNDVPTEGLELIIAGSAVTPAVQPQMGAFMGTATLTNAVSGNVTLQAVATDRAGNTSMPQSVTFELDLDAPTLTFLLPTGAFVNQSQFEVKVEAPAELVGKPIRLTSTDEAGASTDHGELMVGANRTVTWVITRSKGAHVLTATADDAAGNTGTATKQTTVDIEGCNLTVTPTMTPVTFGLVDDENMNPADGLQYTMQGTSTDCLGTAVILLKDNVQVAQTTTDATSGAFTFPIVLNDGEKEREFTVSITDPAGNNNAVTLVLSADLTPPAISGVIPAAPSVFLVSATNENMFAMPTPTPGYVVDKVPGGNGEIDLAATITGAAGGTLSVTANGMPFGTSISITTDPQTLTFNDQVFPQNSTVALVISVEDPGKNTATYSMTVTTDVIAPAAPTVTQLALANARSASVTVGWTATGDDGTSGSATDYLVRWSTALVVPNGITTHAEFFDAAKTEAAQSSPFASAQTAATIGGLPPLNDYSVRVVARDELGNVSPLNTEAAVNNRWAPPVVVSNPTTTTGNKFFGYHLVAGDFNGGADDLVVTAPTDGAGKVFIYYDGAALNSTAPQVLVPPVVTTSGQVFGSDASAGYADDTVNGGTLDLLVGSSGFTSARGRAILYFGQNAQLDPNNYLEFRGTTTGTNFGQAARFVGDVNNDGLHDIIIGAYTEASGEGRAYLFYGRTRVAWDALRVTDPTDNALVVLTSAADKVFTGAAGQAHFARRRGFASLGDITGDGVGDFSIPAPRTDVQKMYLYSGAAVQAATSPILVTSATSTLAPSGALSGTSGFGFGVSAVGGLNLYGAAAPELVVGRASDSRLYIYEDGTNGSFATERTISGVGGMGLSLASGDLNGDGAPDIGTGENVSNSRAWLFFNKGSGYDRVAGSGLHQARLTSTHATTALGSGVAFGDFDDDGQVDFAAGDQFCGSTSGPGCVMIWR